ncbi:MAG: tRNA lysidine(34) synthetase TilS [Litoreibacter sp.]
MQLSDDDELLRQFRTVEILPQRAKRIGLAVSGGGDSMAMLHLQAVWAKVSGTQLYAATVDHGLRAEAVDEAKFVGNVCDKLEIPHAVLKWTGWDQTGNLQARARAARYALLAKWARDTECDAVCLGHTGTDVAENFLMRLSRSAGVDGLAEMSPKFEREEMTFLRPLLGFSRVQLRDFLNRNEHAWCEDPSNDDDRYERVRMRKALSVLSNLGITEDNLRQVSKNLRGTKKSITGATRQLAEEVLDFRDGDICIAHEDYVSMDPEGKRRILAFALQWMAKTPYPPRAKSVADLDLTIASNKPHTIHGCQVTFDRERTLRITREYNAVKTISSRSDEIWDNRWLFEGPHEDALEVRALGEFGLQQCPEWRDAGMPRTSLLSSPSLWRGEVLIAAPLANLTSEWAATLVRGKKHFLSCMDTH